MRFLVLCLVPFLTAPAYAADDDVPEHIQGRWASEGETCDAARMVVSATSLVYSDGRMDNVFFSPEDGADGAILFRQEGEVTNYEYVRDSDSLIFHPEGFGMGSALPMQRCAEQIATAERRCGWLANLTPGNWSLADADRIWTLSAQGDDNAAVMAVMDAVPGFDETQFVSTGTYSGYGCACLSVATDPTLSRITAISSSKRLPLSICEADKALPDIGG